MKRFYLFILTLLLCISHAWGASSLRISICGVDFVTSEVGPERNLVPKLNEKLGAGSVFGEIYYNNGYLTLKNVTLKSKVPYGWQYFIKGETTTTLLQSNILILELEGSNVIDVTLPLGSGLMGFADDVALSGSGSLSATFNSEYPDAQGVTPLHGINVSSAFTGYAEFVRTDNATNARMVGSGNAIVSDNHMMIASGNPNVRYSTLTNSSIMSATLQGHSHTFSTTDGYKYLRVNSLKKTNLYVAGKQVDYTNYRDIFGDGTVQLSGKTLSFTNANIKYSSVGKPFVYYDVNDGIAEDVRNNVTYSGSTRSISDINLYGSNSIEVSAFGDSYSAFSGYSASFSGTGSLKLSVHNTIGDSYAFDDDIEVSEQCYLSVKTSTGKDGATNNVMVGTKTLNLENTTNYFVATGNTLPVSNVTLSSATVGGLNKRYANFGYYDASTYAKPTFVFNSGSKQALQALGYIGKSVNVDLKAVAGGKTPYYYSATGLPAGLSIDSETGVISGTYTTADAGGKTVTIKVTDFLGNSATGTYTTPLVSEKMIFADDDFFDLPDNRMVRAVEITPINCASAVSNAVSPCKYTATGLPAGVTIDATTGVISGAPTSTKDTTSTATITLTDAAGQSESIEIYVGRVFENYEFKVAGVNVTEINKDKIYDGRGLISYQPESKTLMINNTHIRYTSSSFTSFVDTEGKVETVNVTGTSEIVITTNYITCGFPNSIKITGDGDLHMIVASPDKGHVVKGDIEIVDNATIEFGGQIGVCENGKITVPNDHVLYYSNTSKLSVDDWILLPQTTEDASKYIHIKNDKELLAADGGVRFTEELEALTLYNGIPMSFSVADYVEGGIKPYTYSVTGLPTELNLSLDAATGVLSGIPFITKNVLKNVTFTVTDGIGRQVSAKCALVLKVNLEGLSYETVGGTSQISGVTTWSVIFSKSKSLEPNQLMCVDYDTETLGVTLPTNVIGKDANDNWYADDIVLTDAVAYSNPYDVKAKKITYTRNFSTTVVGNKAWQALFVPFAIDVTKYTDFDVAKIFTICPTKDTDGNGQLDDNDDMVMVISPVKSSKTIPNVPYLIRPKKSGSNVIIAENTTLESSDKADYVKFSTSNTEYTVTGVYDNMELKPGDNNYYMATSGNISYRSGSPATLKPNKWYMHAESIGYGHGEHAVDAETRALKFNIMVIGEDIDEAPSFDDVNGNVGTENMIFTVNGVRLNSLDNAPAGIYIVNGKKVIKTNK
ncbi:MAG: Ig domain-containing protein [Paludibacteraceae bacterium]|nr:Ig domain-containing protein [Paludibacteraceae bacterium]